jgi:hypothetical protein
MTQEFEPQEQQEEKTREDTLKRQNAALKSANRNLKEAREQEQKERMEREHQFLPISSSSGGGLLPKKLSDNEVRQRSRLEPESVYNNHSGEILLPRYGSSLDQEITGGPDMPTVFARVPTLSEIRALENRTRHLEKQILQREEICHVCDLAFVHGTSDVISPSVLIGKV